MCIYTYTTFACQHSWFWPSIRCARGPCDVPAGYPPHALSLARSSRRKSKARHEGQARLTAVVRERKTGEHCFDCVQGPKNRKRDRASHSSFAKQLQAPAALKLRAASLPAQADSNAEEQGSAYRLPRGLLEINPKDKVVSTYHLPSALVDAISHPEDMDASRVQGAMDELDLLDAQHEAHVHVETVFPSVEGRRGLSTGFLVLPRPCIKTSCSRHPPLLEEEMAGLDITY